MLLNLIKRIWIEENVPMEWKTNIIVSIYKNKGDRLQGCNYRGISLLYTCYKILPTVLNNRLKNVGVEYLVNTRQDLEQKNQPQTKFWQLKINWKRPGNNVEIYRIFVDFHSACDRIQRDKLYEIMTYFGIPNKLIRL
jgi:hypothetical protein